MCCLELLLQTSFLLLIQVLKKNNRLSIYFENCKQTLPRIDQLYNFGNPVFHLPKIKHKFAEQLPDYQLVKLLNENGSFRISSKVFTHSKKGIDFLS